MGIQDHKVRSFVQNNKKDEIFFFSEVGYLFSGYGGEREKGRRAEAETVSGELEAASLRRRL